MKTIILHVNLKPSEYTNHIPSGWHEKVAYYLGNLSPHKMLFMSVVSDDKSKIRIIRDSNNRLLGFRIHLKISKLIKNTALIKILYLPIIVMVAMRIIQVIRFYANHIILVSYGDRTNIYSWFAPFLLKLLDKNVICLYYKHSALFWVDGYPNKRVKLYSLRKYLLRPLMFILEKLSLRKLDGIISVSPFDKQFVDRFFGVPFFYIPVPVDYKEVIDYKEDTRKVYPHLFEKLDKIKRKKLIILHYAIGLFEKGTLDIIKALSAYKKDIGIILLANRCITRDIGDFVIWLPRLDKNSLYFLFKHVHTMVLGNKDNIRAGIGIILVEFMYRVRKKVISTTLPILGLNNYKRFGFYFRTDEELRQIIGKIIKSKKRESLLKIDEKSLSILVNIFDPYRIAEKWRSLVVFYINKRNNKQCR